MVIQDESVLEALGKLGCEQSPRFHVGPLQTANVQVYTRSIGGARLVDISRGTKSLDSREE